MTTDPLSPAYRFDLFRPELLAIDIETGTNLFTYYWPKIQDQTAFRNLTGTSANEFYKLFPVIKSSSNYIPYALSDPLALDLRNGDSHIVGDDGFVDTVYVGDLLGNFYGIKFSFDSQVTDSTGTLVANTLFGIRVDWWQTKETYEGNPATKSNLDDYRGPRQPITVPPVASFDSADTNFLHVIFGAGKWEDIPNSTDDDTIDPGRNSIYNLKDLVELPTTSFFDTTKAQTVGNFTIEVNPRCPQANTTCSPAHTIRNWPKTGDSQCTWLKPADLTRDCGETNCPQPANPSNPCVDTCWNCIFDLTGPSTDLTHTLPGERVVRKGLIANGLLYITTYIPPQTICDNQGSSKLYVLSYDCGPISNGKNPFGTAVNGDHLTPGATGTTDSIGWSFNLGGGVASNPVLAGDQVVIQLSTGDIWKNKISDLKPVVPMVGGKGRGPHLNPLPEGEGAVGGCLIESPLPLGEGQGEGEVTLGTNSIQVLGKRHEITDQSLSDMVFCLNSPSDLCRPSRGIRPKWRRDRGGPEIRPCAAANRGHN